MQPVVKIVYVDDCNNEETVTLDEIIAELGWHYGISLNVWNLKNLKEIKQISIINDQVIWPKE